MSAKQRSIRAELEQVPGAVLTPVRWVVIAGIIATLPLRFGQEVNIHRPAVLAVVAIYAAVAAGLPYLRGRPLSLSAIGRLLAAADLQYRSGSRDSVGFGCAATDRVLQRTAPGR